jgi:cache domain-containing protein
MRFGPLCVALLLLLAHIAPAAAAAADTKLTLEPGVGLNALAALVDKEFEYTSQALDIVASSENARSGSWERMKGPLALLATSNTNIAAVWFVQPDGSYFTVDKGRTGQSLKNRAYFPTLMAGTRVIGFLVISNSTGKRSAIVAVPIRVGAQVIGAVGASIAMENLSAEIGRLLALPENTVFYALDQGGQIAFHRETPLLFEFATQLGSPTLTKAVGQMLVVPHGEVRYQFQGARRTAIFRKSSVTGWVYALRW